MEERDVVRTWCHLSGASDIKIDFSGKFAVSCGADKHLRIHNLDDESESQEASGIAESNSDGIVPDEYVAMAISPKNNVVMFATEGKAVVSLSYPQLKERKVLARFTSGVVCLDFDRFGEKVAAAGKDMTVKILNSEGGENTGMLQGHKGTIRSVKWDPQGEFIATSSCDGTSKIWKAKTYQCVKTLNVHTKIDDDDAEKAYLKYELDWMPLTGATIAIPVKTQVHLYERNTWRVSKTIETKHKDLISLVRFSSNGEYLMTASLDNSIILHCYVSGTRNWSPVSSIESASSITSMVWNPRANSLAFLSDDGAMSYWRDPIPEQWPKSFRHLESEANVGKEEVSGASEPSTPVEQVQEDHVPSRASGKRKYTPVIEDEAEEDEIVQEMEELQTKKAKRHEFSEDELDMEFEDEIPQMEPMQVVPTVEFSVSSHPAIQPSSTPLSSGRYGNCFLSWNMIGKLIRSKDESTNRIEVNFNDVQGLRNIKFGDDYNISIGTLGKAGALFGALGSHEERAVIYYRPFENITNEWTFNLEGEDPLGVAIGNAFCAVATSENLLRVFNLYGLQLMILSVPGSPVAVCASDSLLCVVYSEYSVGASNDQDFFHKLKFSVYKVDDFGSITAVHEDKSLPISKGSYLSWVGFSSDEILHSVDTRNIVRSLLPASFTNGTTWIPVFDGERNLERRVNLWVIGIVSRSLLYIPMKESEYPSPMRIPVPARTELTIPLLQPSSSYENELLFARIAYGAESNAKAKEKLLSVVEANILYIFRQVCTNNKVEKAKALLEYLKTDKSLVVAVQIAEKCNQRKLSMEILGEVKKKLELRRAEEEILSSVEKKPAQDVNQSEKPSDTQIDVTQSEVMDTTNDGLSLAERTQESDLIDDIGDDGTFGEEPEPDPELEMEPVMEPETEIEPEFDGFQRVEVLDNAGEAAGQSEANSIFDILGGMKKAK